MTTDEILPLLDDGALHTLAQDTGDEIVGVLVGEFLAEAARRVLEVAEAATAADMSRLGFEGHALKSTCATFGAARLGARASRIERAVKDGDDGNAIAGADGIVPEFEATSKAFRARFPSSDPPDADVWTVAHQRHVSGTSCTNCRAGGGDHASLVLQDAMAVQTIKAMKQIRYNARRALMIALTVGVLAGFACLYPDTARATDVASKDAEAVVAPVTPAARVAGKGFGAFLAARQARRDGDIAAAARYFNAALEADPDNLWLLRRAFLLTVSEGDVAAALPLANRILDGDMAAPVANLTVAVDELKNGLFGKGEARISNANKRRGSMRLVGPLLRAWAAYGNGDGAASAQRLDPLDRTEAFVPFANYHRALILAAAGDLDGALAAFATYEDSARPDLRSMLAKASITGRRDGAEAGQAALEALRPRFGEDHVLVAYLSGERALDDAFPIRDANDGIAEALYGAASALVRDNVSDVAMIYLRLSLHVRPDLDVAQALLGDIRETNDRWLDAIAAYEGVSQQSPYKWGARLRTAWMLDKLDRTDQAIELLQRMASERSRETIALITLADMLRTHSRFEEAATIYSRALERVDELEPRHWAVLYSRGIALERSGRWTDAERDLLQALELRPRHPYIMNYLAYSWADKGMRLDEAVEMLRSAVALKPQDGYIVDSLGWVLFRKGDHAEAVRQLERAVELRPEDPTINEHLGDAYWHVGRRLESCFQWRRVLVLGPEEYQVESVIQKLNKGLEKDADHFRGCT